MTFQVLPAIDVSGGRLCRMSAEGPAPVDAYGGDPMAAASAFVRAGTRWIHFVDVDLATTGTPGNLDRLRAVADLGVAVQASGGVTTTSDVEALLSAGAERVVLGSAALADRNATEGLVRELGERLCVGIEADGPTIRPRGRGEDLPLWETLTWLADLDVRRFVFTEIGRVGGMSGPDLDGIWALARHTGRPVLASGGIRDLQDLQAVARLGEPVEGAIVGRALQEALDLAEVLRAIA